MVIFAYDENSHFLEVRHAFGIDITQAVVIQITKIDGLLTLAYLNAIENSASHITGALEGIDTVGHHGDSMLSRFELGHQPVVLALSQEISPNRWGIKIGVIEINKGITSLSTSRYRHTDSWLLLFAGFGLCRRALKSLVHFVTGDQHAPDRAIPGQEYPVGRFTHIHPHLGWRPGSLPFALDNAAGYRDTVSGSHDGPIHHNHGNCRPGDGVDVDEALALSCSHLDTVGHRPTDVTLGELEQGLFRDPHKQNGLMMLKYLGTCDFPFGIYPHQEVNRLA